MTTVKIFETPLQTAKQLARDLATYIRRTIGQKQIFSIALSGSRTPEILFEVLVKDYADVLQNPKLHFFWVDERCVPWESDQSNYGEACRFIFNKLAINESRLHPMFRGKDTETSAKEYEIELNSLLKLKYARPVFDVILMGVGDDGHTASIFHNQMHLIDHKHHVATAKHPTSGQDRITLTGKVLNNALMTVYFIIGKQKAPIIKRVANEDYTLPATHIQGSKQVFWYVDKDAASELSE